MLQFMNCLHIIGTLKNIALVKNMAGWYFNKIFRWWPIRAGSNNVSKAD